MTWVCPGVDTAVFEANCHLPLMPNVWNVWRMIRTNRDAPPGPGQQGSWPAPDLITNGIWRCLRWWLKRVDPTHPDPIAPFDSLSFAPEPPAPNMVLVASATDATRLKCLPDGMISVSNVPGNGPNPEYYVSFVYRGGSTQMPWPAYKVNEFGVPDWCPVDADWIVAEVYTYKPGEMPVVPDPEPWLKIPDMPNVINPSQSLTGVIFWGAVGLFTASVIANRLLGSDR